MLNEKDSKKNQRFINSRDARYAILLIAGSASLKLAMFCSTYETIPSGYTCLRELSSIEDILSFITDPFGPAFAWIVGDAWLAIILGFISLFFTALFCVHAIRWLYGKIRRLVI
jgi:hypothetical protein